MGNVFLPLITSDFLSSFPNRWATAAQGRIIASAGSVDASRICSSCLSRLSQTSTTAQVPRGQQASPEFTSVQQVLSNNSASGWSAGDLMSVCCGGNGQGVGPRRMRRSVLCSGIDIQPRPTQLRIPSAATTHHERQSWTIAGSVPTASLPVVPRPSLRLDCACLRYRQTEPAGREDSALT